MRHADSCKFASYKGTCFSSLGEAPLARVDHEKVKFCSLGQPQSRGHVVARIRRDKIPVLHGTSYSLTIDFSWRLKSAWTQGLCIEFTVSGDFS